MPRLLSEDAFNRTTCRSCEEAGEVTVLIQYAHWKICPIHEPQFLAPVSDSAPLEKGVPGWPKKG